jgi:hypothetical protein
MAVLSCHRPAKLAADRRRALHQRTMRFCAKDQYSSRARFATIPEHSFEEKGGQPDVGNTADTNALVAWLSFIGSKVEDLRRRPQSPALAAAKRGAVWRGEAPGRIGGFRRPALSILLNSLELQTDLHPLGRFLMRLLQYLQLGCPSRRWVLKSPDHIFALEGLLAVFPDAVFIQTHRDPLEVLKSSS